MALGVPSNLGGSLQLAVEGAQRWWRDMGRQEIEEMFGLEVAQNEHVQAAAVMGFLCGRLEVDKAAVWERAQVAIREGKDQGRIVVPGKDLTDLVT